MGPGLAPFEGRAERPSGWSVFLSVGWSWEGRRSRPPESTAILIDEAVVSLVRAVAAEGGNIAMVEHPAFSPLVAFILGQYRAVRRVEEEEDQSEPASRREPPSLWMCRERGSPSPPRDLHAELETLQVYFAPLGEFLPKARPLGMACIGGGQQMAHHYEIFRQVVPRGTVYTLATTGGMAAELARLERPSVRAIDEEIQQRLEQAARESQKRFNEETGEHEPELVPYPLIMQELVGELGRGETPGNPEPTPEPTPRPSSPSLSRSPASGS